MTEPATPAQYPLVSITMPVYNSSEYLSEAIDSVISQTYPHWELVCVDDGSTDNSLDILTAYAESDSRIRACHIQHKGRGAARNACLAHCTGKYIAIFDSDDISLSHRLERQVAYLEGHDEIGVVSAQVACFTGASEPKIRFRYPEAPETIKRTYDAGKMGVAHCASMFRRDLLERTGAYNEAFLRAQDLELFLRLNEVTLFAMLPEVLVNYRTDPAVLRYELWQRLSRYSRYAVHCRDRFRQQLPPMAMAPWTRTLTAIAQIHLIDNIRFVKHHIKHRLILR